MTPTTPIRATCSKRYRASRTSGTRGIERIRWIVLHDAEAPDAESVALFFSKPQATGSAHLVVDDDHCFRTLDNEDIPWGASSAFQANLHGFHIEQCGFARWSSTAWLLHRATLNRAAYKTALHCKLFDIPPVFVFAAQLPNVDGITTHREVTLASKRIDPEHAGNYDHTDPGIFWPRRWFMDRVRAYYAELSV